MRAEHPDYNKGMFAVWVLSLQRDPSNLALADCQRAKCQLLSLDRLHGDHRQVIYQPDFLLQEWFGIFHAGQHSIEPGHGRYALADFCVSREVGASGFLIGVLRSVRVDGFEARLKLLGDVYDKGWANVVVERCVDDLERT